MSTPTPDHTWSEYDIDLLKEALLDCATKYSGFDRDPMKRRRALDLYETVVNGFETVTRGE